MVEVDDGDACTDTVRVGNEVRVHAGLRVTEVRSGGHKCGKGDVGGGDRPVEGVVGLEGIFSCLRRAILGERVNYMHVES